MHLGQRTGHFGITRFATRCVIMQRTALQLGHQPRNQRRMRELKPGLADVDAAVLAGPGVDWLQPETVQRTDVVGSEGGSGPKRSNAASCASSSACDSASFMSRTRVALDAKPRVLVAQAAAADERRASCLAAVGPGPTVTTGAALFGALPLALGTGAGSELRAPVGVALVGGLLVSQTLTLFTTPVIYLYLDRLSQRLSTRLAAGSVDVSKPQ